MARAKEKELLLLIAQVKADGEGYYYCLCKQYFVLNYNCPKAVEIEFLNDFGEPEYVVLCVLKVYTWSHNRTQECTLKTSNFIVDLSDISVCVYNI